MSRKRLTLIPIISALVMNVANASFEPMVKLDIGYGMKSSAKIINDESYFSTSTSNVNSKDKFIYGLGVHNSLGIYSLGFSYARNNAEVELLDKYRRWRTDEFTVDCIYNAYKFKTDRDINLMLLAGIGLAVHDGVKITKVKRDSYWNIVKETSNRSSIGKLAIGLNTAISKSISLDTYGELYTYNAKTGVRWKLGLVYKF